MHPPCFLPTVECPVPPSLHRVPVARVPRLPRYYGALRIPAALPLALACFARRYHPPRLLSCLPSARRRPGARSFRVWQPHANFTEMGTAGRPKFLEDPLCLCPGLRPRQDRAHQATTVRRRGPRSYNNEGSRDFVFRGSITGLQHSLSFASPRELPPPDARRASGCWPSSAGRDWLPAGSLRKVLKVLPHILRLLSQAFLAQCTNFSRAALWAP